MKNFLAIPSVLLALMSLGGCPTATILPETPKDTATGRQSASRAATPELSTVVDASGLSEQLTITCATPCALVSYSLDGGSTWQPYGGPATVYHASSIKAAATAEGCADSEVASTVGFQPRALSVPFVTITGQVATARFGAIIYSIANYWAPGTWKVYEGPIDISRVTAFAVQSGFSGQGHPCSSPIALPGGIEVTFMSVLTSLAPDWSSYRTDLWVGFSKPVTGSVTCDGAPCDIEGSPDGDGYLYVLRNPVPGTYEVQAQTADMLFFRFQYSSGVASVATPTEFPGS